MSKIQGLKGMAVLLLCASIALAAWVVLRPPADPSGPYSALSRAHLKTVSAGSELLVPLELPTGLDATASSSDFTGSYEVSGVRFKGDEVPFFLTRVLSAADLPEHRREVVTEYQSTVLDRTGRARYEVHQLPEGMGTKGRCAASTEPPIERLVGTTRLLICSADLKRGTPAWDYWAAVSFTNQLKSVDWLRGDS